jgi:hypothetical protein
VSPRATPAPLRHNRELSYAAGAWTGAIDTPLGPRHDRRMNGGVALPPSSLELLDREREVLIAGLVRRHKSALEGNPEGCALLGQAVASAMLLGVRSQCELDELSPASLGAASESTGDIWRAERARTPDALEWPSMLNASAPEEAAEAAGLVAAAATELGLRGRRLRDFEHVGVQAAEAGAALVRVLSRGQPEPPELEQATPATVGGAQPDGSVRVAVAANQAETELLQGLLETAGIPSIWRRTGGDLPHLMSGGYREIYVPCAAAAQAQALLAIVGPASPPPPAQASHRVGLERTGVRLIGKTTAAMMLLGVITGAGLTLGYGHPVVVAATVLGWVLTGGAIVVWSETRSKR